MIKWKYNQYILYIRGEGHIDQLTNAAVYLLTQYLNNKV